MALVQIDRICKSFSPALHALDAVTFSVAQGECLAIVGPSGCGKTTLLRIIAGLEPATAGSVHIAGTRVDALPCHARDVAMLPQRPALVLGQTVRQNLSWTWTLRRAWPPDHDKELIQLAHQLGLDADLDRPVEQLSGGQQQRVALGRCLLRQARVCLLDEPFANLDAPLRAELRRLVRSNLRQHGTTTLLVTHDPGEALAVGDRVAVLQAGRIVQVNTPTQLIERPGHRFVAELMHHDRGGLNVIAGTFRDGVFQGPLGDWRLRGDFLTNPGKLLSESRTFAMLIAIAAERVSTSGDAPPSDERIQVTATVLAQETTPHGNWVIAQSQHGEWVGRADRQFEVGQSVIMTFSLRDCYGFDAATNMTVWTGG